MSSTVDNQNQTNPQKEVLRKELLELNAKRDKIEKEIKEWQSLLQTQNVGMDDSLVDSNGFPRNDIDVHQIRIARNKIICLNNDAKNLMKQIEEKLYQFHEINKQNAEKDKKPEN